MEKVNPIILQLLEKRGIIAEEDIEEFLSEKPKRTYDPFLLLNMEKAVDLILKHIEEKKKICIYGDYDADGITSTSILMQFFKNFDVDIMYYIPSRFDEGYGLNKEALKKIREDLVDLVITVDCGSVSYDEVEYGKSIGLNIVVTDHHSITDIIADCIVVNPKNPACNYPCKYLAGCGVAFKLAQGLQRKAGLPKKAVNELLDLVAVGTIGDIVPLLDENRTLVKYGMNIIREGHRTGLDTLIQSISMDRKKLSSDNVAFGIVPHLNAAGRMKSACVGVELMGAEDKFEIKEIVDQLVEHNRERKKVQQDTFDLCEDLIAEKYLDDNFFIVDCPEAHEGIAGIVAGKIKDKYSKPVLILTPTEDGFLKGTGRSIKNVNLYDVLKEQEALFERFGGHSGACGLLMKEENLEALRKGIFETIERMLDKNPDLLNEELDVDLYLNAGDITYSFISDLNRLAPFGNSNEKPCIALKDVRLDKIQYMGAKKTHARFIAKCEDGSSIGCVLFGKAQDMESILNAQVPVCVYGSPEISEWNGRRNIQMLVNDIKML